MILDVDLGNSALRWRRHPEGVIQRLYHGGDPAVVERQLRALLEDASIRLGRWSCVAGAPMAAAVVSAFEGAGRPHRRAQVSRECGGVSNGYRILGNLGVDRWLAALAASRLGAACVLVVDAGTAINVEVVAQESEAWSYRGGYIVPGYGLLVDSLKMGTQVVVETELAAALCPGTDTPEAVAHGINCLVMGFVEKLWSDHSRAGVTPLLVITGGDAERLLPLFPQARHVPGLVLDGLDVMFPPNLS